MLERATACIKVRATRDSLQRAQQHTRRASKRLLHQNFWTHGAGELELLTFATISTPSTDLPQKHDNQRTSKHAALSNTSNKTAADSPFLDFLYPPQALTYLNRVNKQHLEGGERRNTRRLPDGFVHLARGYSSASRARAAHDTIDDQDDGGHDTPLRREFDTSQNHVRGGDTSDQSSTARKRSLNARQMTKELLYGEEDESPPAESVDTLIDDSEASYADSPGDLSEMLNDFQSEVPYPPVAGSTDPAAQCLLQLRAIMSLKRHLIDQHHIRRAWRLYLSLHDGDRQELRLKEKLLAWFDDRSDEWADAFIISLFWSIPLEARTLAVYQIVARSFLRPSPWTSLRALHSEALSNIPNGDQVTLQLFCHELQSANWNSLCSVVKDHEDTLLAGGREQRVEMFWVQIAELPDLIDHVLAILPRAVAGPRERQLRLRLCKEALQQASDQLLIGQPSGRRLRSVLALLRLITKLDPDAHNVYQLLLTRLLPRLGQFQLEQKKNQPGSVALREESHQVISYLYWHFRDHQDARLHPDLMLIWLNHLTRRMDETNVERRSKLNVTADMVIEDWQSWHNQISAEAVHTLISCSAHAGSVDALKKWTAYLNRHYPDYQEQRKTFWAQVRVHARLSNLAAAKKAFEDVTRAARAHGDRVDIKCWNVLLHAYGMSDDLDGAYAALRELLQSTQLIPDKATMLPILDLLARRGDVDAMENILQQYDVLTKEKRPIEFVHMQIMALNFVDDTARAERLLAETLSRVRLGEIRGSLTKSFNLMLAKYASSRDIDATMHVYQRMRENRIHRDQHTYKHLMQALANFRQTNAAWAILTQGMKRDGFEPTALHYTVAMAGFIHEHEPKKAIVAHRHMLAKNVRQSLSTKENLLKAKALIEKDDYNTARTAGKAVPRLLENAVEELRLTVESIRPRDISGSRLRTAHELFSPVMWLLGGEKHLQGVEKLFQDSKAVSETYGHSPWPTLRLSSALMNALYHSKEFGKVEAYWKVVKTQVDQIVASSTVPDFVACRQGGLPISSPESIDAASPSQPTMDDQAELGFVTRPKLTAQPERSPQSAAHAASLGPRPAPARRHVLSRPFRIYLASLVAQGRLGDAIKEATRLLTQGYKFDNITWNRFIEYIAGSDPPLTLLAFTLMERYLMRNFPGWVRRESRYYRPRKSARATGMQYIRARYLGQTELMPQYRTIIWLAKALLEVKRREAVGWQGNSAGQKIDPSIGRLVGTIKQIQENAPRTFTIVQLMPRIEDKWQNRLLRGIGWEFPPDADRLRTIGDAQLILDPNGIDAELSTQPPSIEGSASLTDADIDVDQAETDNSSAPVG